MWRLKWIRENTQRGGQIVRFVSRSPVNSVYAVLIKF